MASSKGDAKPRKIVDVASPGKTAPPATARPIIVTNRPILKRDPMMASPDGPDASDESPVPVSRVAKSINVLGGDPAPAAESEAISAVPAESDAPVVAPVKSTGKTIKPITITHVDQEVAMDVGKEALASIEDGGEKLDETKPVEDTPASVVSIIPAELPSEPSDGTIADPKEPALTAVTTSTPTKDDKVTSDTDKSVAPTEKPATVSGEPTPESKGSDGLAQAITPSPALTSTSTTPEVEPESESEPESAPDDADSADEQLPASQVLEDEKRKKEEEAAQLAAEQEKVIASKRYYLPIKKRGSKRGVVRAVLVLILVLLLSVVWLDVVLDAGIVHISGLHALTNLFK